MNTTATHTDTHVPAGDFYAMRAQRDALLAAAEAVLADCPTCGSSLVSTAAQMESHDGRNPTHNALRAAIQKAGA